MTRRAALRSGDRTEQSARPGRGRVKYSYAWCGQARISMAGQGRAGHAEARHASLYTARDRHSAVWCVSHGATATAGIIIAASSNSRKRSVDMDGFPQLPRRARTGDAVPACTCPMQRRASVSHTWHWTLRRGRPSGRACARVRASTMQ
jgi:hypothetical protein